jgi:YidC/Oxa1 family membrane protein insertase
MDIKRSILLVALAVVAYLMVLQWNQDYGQTAIPDETRQSQTSARRFQTLR